MIIPEQDVYVLPTGCRLLLHTGDLNGVIEDPDDESAPYNRERLPLVQLVATRHTKKRPSVLLINNEHDSAKPIPRKTPSLATSNVALILTSPLHTEGIIEKFHRKHPVHVLEELLAASATSTRAPHVMLHERSMIVRKARRNQPRTLITYGDNKYIGHVEKEPVMPAAPKYRVDPWDVVIFIFVVSCSWTYILYFR